MARGEPAPYRPFRDLERWGRRFPSYFEDWPFGEREPFFPALESFREGGQPSRAGRGAGHRS